MKLGRQVSLDNYFSDMLQSYSAKRLDQSQFRITLQSIEPPGTGRQWVNMPALQRFTERYRKRTYYRLQPLMDLRPTYFFTLTFPNRAESVAEYEDMFADQKHRWKKCMSWLRKYAPGSQIFRVFELTENNSLHVHAIMFTDPTTRVMEKFSRYYHNNHGFIDLKKFYFYDKYIQTNKFWINDDGTPDNWKVDSVNEVTDPDRFTIVANYVMKYQLKEVKPLHQAIFTKFKCRTYSTTRALGSLVRKILPTGKWSKVNQDYLGEDTPTNYIRATMPKPKIQLVADKRPKTTLEILFRPNNSTPGGYDRPSYPRPGGRQRNLFSSAFKLLGRTREYYNLAKPDPVRKWINAQLLPIDENSVNTIQFSGELNGIECL